MSCTKSLFWPRRKGWQEEKHHQSGKWCDSQLHASVRVQLFEGVPLLGHLGNHQACLSFQTVLTGVKVNLPQRWKRLISKAVTF